MKRHGHMWRRPPAVSVTKPFFSRVSHFRGKVNSAPFPRSAILEGCLQLFEILPRNSWIPPRAPGRASLASTRNSKSNNATSSRNHNSNGNGNDTNSSSTSAAVGAPRIAARVAAVRRRLLVQMPAQLVVLVLLVLLVLLPLLYSTIGKH